MMNLTYCDTTREDGDLSKEASLSIGITFHHLGLILSAGTGLFAVMMSLFLVFMHATHYLRPNEQKHIIRILFMVPVYSIVSFLSYYKWQHAIYYEVLRDCYEAFAIASFFTLLCHYIAPDLHSQKDYFRTITPKAWVFPLSWFKCLGGPRGCLRTPRSGLTWFNIIWFCVFQYCMMRVLMTIVAVSTEAIDKYCVSSWSPAFAHAWVSIVEGLCVTVAMFCLIQFYVQLKDDLAEQRPFLKLLAIKLVIFLCFWQSLFLGVASSSSVGWIKASDKLMQPDITTGLPALAICIEMALFSLLHIWAYPWSPYDLGHYPLAEPESGLYPATKSAYRGGPLGIKALADAFNPFDMIKSIGRGFRWMLVGRRHREQDISYKASRVQTSSVMEPLPGAHGKRASGRYERLDGFEDAVPLQPQNQGFAGRADSPYGQTGRKRNADLGTVFPNASEELEEQQGYHAATNPFTEKERAPRLGHDQDTTYRGRQPEPGSGPEEWAHAR